MNYSRFKEIVRLSGKTLKEIAIGAGMSSQALNVILSGGDMKVSTLEKISASIGVTPEYILGEIEVKIELRGGKKIFLNSGRLQDSNVDERIEDLLKVIEAQYKTITAKEETISTQKMVIELLKNNGCQQN